MKLALVADLHGNFSATKAVEEDIKKRNIDKIWCLGDLIGKGPRNDLTCDWAFASCELILLGNWDEAIAKKIYSRDDFYISQLGKKRLEKMLCLPKEKHFELSGQKIRLLHGRPSYNKVMYIHDEQDTLNQLLLPNFNICGFADCHRQGLRTLSGSIFNTGSVGNALGFPRAQYAIIEGDEKQESSSISLSFISLDYDKKEEAAAMKAQKKHPHPDAYISEIMTGIYYQRFRK